MKGRSIDKDQICPFYSASLKHAAYHFYQPFNKLKNVGKWWTIEKIICTTIIILLLYYNCMQLWTHCKLGSKNGKKVIISYIVHAKAYEGVHCQTQKHLFKKKFNVVAAQKTCHMQNTTLTGKSFTDNPSQCKFWIILSKCLSTGHSK